MDMQIEPRLDDDALLARLRDLAASGRRNTVEVLRLLIEVEDRRLHLAEAHGSLFGFCLDVLKLSEGETANRIHAARAARRFPVVLDRLRAGDITLTTVRLLAPHLTDENHQEVLDRARNKTRTQVEHLVV